MDATIRLIVRSFVRSFVTNDYTRFGIFNTKKRRRRDEQTNNRARRYGFHSLALLANALAAAPRPPRPRASKSETTPSYGLFASPRSTRSGLNLSLPRIAAYTHAANPTNTSNVAPHPIPNSPAAVDVDVDVDVPACASAANPTVAITIASVRISIVARVEL